MCVQYNPYSNRLSVKMAVPNARFIRQQMSSADVTPANFKAMLQEENEMDYYDDMDFDEEYETFEYDEDSEYEDEDDEDYDDFRRRLNIDDFYDLDDEEYDERDQGKVFPIYPV